jgi:DNA-binding NarL/FixJ family response regulator
MEAAMRKPIRLLLADDHNVLRQGMAQVLDMQPDIEIVAQADNGDEAVRLVAQHRPDIVLMDINMPGVDGVAAARQITSDFPDIGVIILTMYRRDDYVFEAIKAGANGYLLKEVELDELLEAIRAVARGEAVMDSAIASRVLAEFRRPQPPPADDAAPDLAERDLQILRLVALSNQDIADRLFIAEKTVRNRLSSIFHRLHLENRTQAALYAIQEGIAEPSLPDEGEGEGSDENVQSDE